LDDHYRGVYEEEKAKAGLSEEPAASRSASRSAWGEDSGAAHIAWSESPAASEGAWAEGGREWEDGSQYATDQVARLERKLQAATEEASAKSKALQGLRLEKDDLSEELARAVRDLDLLRDHCELREASVRGRRRDWREVITRRALP
jgi:hypothetical protein